MLLLLSPSCPVCATAAKAIQKKVLGRIEDKNLKVFVVWMPALPPDNRDWAIDAEVMISDKRAAQYWDAKASLGLRFGRSLKLPKGGSCCGKNTALAWGTYMMFDGKARWGSSLPKPDPSWMQEHQPKLKERAFDADKLRELVADLLKAKKKDD